MYVGIRWVVGSYGYEVWMYVMDYTQRFSNKMEGRRSLPTFAHNILC